VFNKSTLFNRTDPRTDPVTRRDSLPVTPGGARSTPAAEQPGGRPAPAGKEIPGMSAMSSTPATTPRADAVTVSPPVVEAKPVATDASAETVMGARLIVGPEVKLKGAEILDCDTLVVEGRVEATMDSRVVRIAEHGAFVGKVSIDIAEIHGSFEGELTARSQLIIHSTGRVKGTIRYGRLVAEEGCELCGDVAVLSPSQASKTKPGNDVLETLDAPAG